MGKGRSLGSGKCLRTLMSPELKELCPCQVNLICQDHIECLYKNWWPPLSAIDDKDERIFRFLDPSPKKLVFVIAEVRDIHSGTESGWGRLVKWSWKTAKFCLDSSILWRASDLHRKLLKKRVTYWDVVRGLSKGARRERICFEYCIWAFFDQADLSKLSS